jgi:predicted 3-demethylubiquinone-9 3-methyltransferase (glyoxalase superfamily)
MRQITPCLWFDTQGEEAVTFYTTVFSAVFSNSRILDVARYGAAGPRPEGSVMTVTFELDGQRFVALNGGPEFTFNEAISFQVSCQTQEEVDHFWSALSEGGQEGPCGWLKDRYGVSWQIVPTALAELLSDPDPARSQAAMKPKFRDLRAGVPMLTGSDELRRSEL